MIKKMKLFIKKLDSNAIVPTYGSTNAAGADLYALSNGNLVVNPGETVFVHTGIAMEIPEGYVGLVYARSGMACKSDLAPANKVGVIDSDYRGEIMVALHNHGKEVRTVENGQDAILKRSTNLMKPLVEKADSVQQEKNKKKKNRGIR